MNILNLAIDQESVQIITHIRNLYAARKDIIAALVNHTYSREMKAVH